MPESVITSRKLTKHYGRQRGITDLDLDVHRGEVFGFLGPNGAGKSTTINVLMQFRMPSSGSFELFGQQISGDTPALRRRIGYLPGELELYERMTGRQLLRYFGNLRGSVDWPYVTGLVERFACELDRPIKTLSKGNKQKLGLIQAWMHRPELLILDEPTSGLDPLMQREFYRLVKEAKKDGTTVFMSSHVMSEVERICDRAAIVREGKLIGIETMRGLHELALRHLEIHFAEKPPVRILKGLEGVSDVRTEGTVLYCTVHGSMDRFIKALAKFKVRNLISEHASLEELFFKEYGQRPEVTDAE